LSTPDWSPRTPALSGTFGGRGHTSTRPLKRRQCSSAWECWESEDALASWRQIANAPELPGVEMRDVQVAKHFVDKTTSRFGWQ
jgi:hypothetical protein